jgi:hypothetical protein
LDYGPLPTDIRHNVQVTQVLEVPLGKGKRLAQTGPVAYLLGGWQINTVLSIYSGLPFTPTSSNTTLNATGSFQFADCPVAPHQLNSILQWYNKSEFAVPTAGRFGSCGIYSLRGPGLVNADLGMDRKFMLKERLELKFRAEVFNIANTPHHAVPNGNITSSSFMQATGIANTGREGIDERNFRMSLRLGW